ncbi:MAG: hypothetical protein Q9224_004680, partial [Gallowayella concinna]
HSNPSSSETGSTNPPADDNIVAQRRNAEPDIEAWLNGQGERDRVQPPPPPPPIENQPQEQNQGQDKGCGPATFDKIASFFSK